MKSMRFFFLFVLALWLGTGSLTQAARADWTPGKRMGEASGRLVGSARAIISRYSSMGFDRDTCLLGAFVRQGRSVSFDRPMETGKLYAVLAGGDNFAQDVDVKITNRRGVTVAQDRSTDPSALAVYRPAVTDVYTVTVTLYRAQGSAFVALTILREGGYDVPVRNLTEALGGCLALGEAANSKIRGTLLFNEEANQWALYGAVLPSGRSMTIDHCRLATGTHVLVATGDTAAQDVDLYLLRNGAAVAKDDDNDKNCVAVADTNSSSTYSVRMKNTRSNGPSLVVTMVLRTN